MAAGLQGYVSATHARWLATAPDRRRRSVDGTLVFADVSGFTAMSEKLARRGKIGAEETTEAVNRVFGGLLHATRACGGEILKFGGDAVLALFEGEAHEARGAAAALQMQASMKPLRRLRTAAGTVSLRLSAGVASGTADLFLAGSAPRELLVTGPLASQVVACESAAQAGQVVASPATLAGFPERCRGEAVGPGLLLRSVPLVPMTDVPQHPPGFDPRPALPLHLHDHEPGDGEHRFASIAFVQFKGTDALCAADPDGLARVLDEIVGSATEACLAYGVTFVSTDVDADGGKVILAAGAPSASPDDEDRLIHALRSIVERDWALPVRAGANRGRIFMVDIGPPERRVWSVMGDAVNLAARVMARAQPGQLLATPSVLDRVRDEFERTPVEPFMVKGKAAPVQADVVGRARGSRRVASAGGELVGREAELAAIAGAMDEARRGRRRVVQLVGEPGIGKSRLVEAALARAAGLAVLGVAGGPYAAHSPYRALRGPLRQLLGAAPDAPDAEVEGELRATVAALDRSLEPWLPLAGIAFGLDLEPTPETAALSPEFARARLNAALGRLVDLLLPAQPSLLVVEDGHWLDEATADFLAHLVRQRRPGHGTCVLLTRRDVRGGLDLSGERGALVLALEPLDAAAALRLVAGGEGDDDATLPPGAEQALIERAGGNPLLLQELVAAARAGQPLDALPDSVEALVMSRVDTLPQRDRHILRQAAVLGVRVPVPLLEQVLGWDAFAVGAALARLDDFLVADGPQTVRFRHALLRDAAYEALPYKRRHELHGRAAELIERQAGERAEQEAELLAIHYHAAHRWAPTWRFARAAADQALARAAPVEAAGFLEHAFEAGRHVRVEPAELVAVAERQGDALKLAGRPAEAAEAYERARRRARGDDRAEAALCLKVGRVREHTQNVTQALRWYTRGLHHVDAARAGPATEALRAKLVLAQGVTRLRGGRLRESLPYLLKAADLAQACGDRGALAHAYQVLDWAYTDLGLPERERYRGLALPIYEELEDWQGQAQSLNNLGIDAYYEGHWEEAVRLYERSRAASERIGDVVEAATATNNIAEIRSDQGHYDAARELFLDALATWRAAGFHIGVGIAHSSLGRLHCRMGDLHEARRHLGLARERLEAIGAEALLLEVQAREAECLLAGGDAAAALALTGEIRAAAERRGPAPTMLALLQRIAGLAKLQLGDRPAAVERFRESLELARSVGALYEEAQALDALGRTAGGAAAAEALEQAGERFARLGVVTADVALR